MAIIDHPAWLFAVLLVVLLGTVEAGFRLGMRSEARGELLRRQIPQRAVRAHRVVVYPPGLDYFSRPPQIHELVLVQAFIPELPVEAFDERVLHEPPSLNEVQRHPMLIGPLIHDPAGELRSVVYLDRGGGPAPLPQPFQHAHLAWSRNDTEIPF